MVRFIVLRKIHAPARTAQRNARTQSDNGETIVHLLFDRYRRLNLFEGANVDKAQMVVVGMFRICLTSFFRDRLIKNQVSCATKLQPRAERRRRIPVSLQTTTNHEERGQQQ